MANNLHCTAVAVVFFSGVNYFSGQVFEMEKITAAAHRKVRQADCYLCLTIADNARQGCLVGWDLAHGIGNIPVKLHDWGADFAVWCTYKVSSDVCAESQSLMMSSSI